MTASKDMIKPVSQREKSTDERIYIELFLLGMLCLLSTNGLYTVPRTYKDSNIDWNCLVPSLSRILFSDIVGVCRNKRFRSLWPAPHTHTHTRPIMAHLSNGGWKLQFPMQRPFRRAGIPFVVLIFSGGHGPTGPACETGTGISTKTPWLVACRDILACSNLLKHSASGDGHNATISLLLRETW